MDGVLMADWWEENRGKEGEEVNFLKDVSALRLRVVGGKGREGKGEGASRVLYWRLRNRALLG